MRSASVRRLRLCGGRNLRRTALLAILIVTLGGSKLAADCPAINISPATLPNASPGVPYMQVLTASGGMPPYGWYDTESAPFAEHNGIITGTPSWFYAGRTINLTVNVQDSSHGGFGGFPCPGSRAYTLTIDPCPTITISPGTLPRASQYTPYSQQLTASGGKPPYTYQLFPQGWLSVSTDGALSGTNPNAGSYSFSIRVVDSNGCFSDQSFTLIIDACPTIAVSPAVLPNATQNSPYSQLFAGSGGKPPYTFFPGWSGGWLNLSHDGVLSGIPPFPGPWSFGVGVTDSIGCSSFQNFNLTINPCPTITISPAILPNASQHTQYSQALTASGGKAPYTYGEVIDQTGWLHLSPSGTLSGIPFNPGLVSFSVQITDSNGCTNGQHFDLIINPCPIITVSPSALPNALQNTFYSQKLTALGATPPYIFDEGSDVPLWLKLSSDGTLSGTPPASGSFSFEVQVTDSIGCSNDQTFNLTVNALPCPAITISPAMLPNASQNTVYSQALIAAGGMAPYTFYGDVFDKTGWLHLFADGTLSGTPTVVGPFSFNVGVNDSNGCANVQGFGLIVSGGVVLPPAVTSFTAGPPTIVAGQSSTLSWTTTNATSVTISGIGPQPVSGAVTVSPTTTTSYTLTATGLGGTVTATKTVVVNPASPPVIVSFAASPSTITAGQSSTLNWTTTNATTVSISGIPGTQPANGSVPVSPPATTTYTLTATGANGTATATTTITVHAAGSPAIVSFAASPPTIVLGQFSTLVWTATNTTSVSISGVTGALPVNGSTFVSPIVTTTYTLTATGPAGTTSATVVLHVTTVLSQPGLRFESYDGAVFTPMTDTGVHTYQNGSLSDTGETYVATGGYPYIMVDDSRNLFLLHPGTFTSTGVMASLGYAITTTGRFVITGAFARANDAYAAGDGVHVLILKNATQLFAADISPNIVVTTPDPFESASAVSFDLSIDASAGDIVRFVVSSGARLADGSFDATGLRMRVSAVTTPVRRRGARH